MSKQHVEQALVLVQDQITKRLNALVAQLPQSAKVLKDLASVGERVIKNLEPNKELHETFHMAISDVLANLAAIRSGYATNGQEVSLDEMAKAAQSPDQAMSLFGSRFVPAVKSASDFEALGTLRVLRDVLSKSLNWEAPTSASTPTVHKDPMQTDKTLENGSIAAMQTAASGDKPILTDPGSTSGEVPAPGSIMAIAATNSGPADVLKSEEDPEIVWPRDMAKGGFVSGKNGTFADALAAVQKSNEPVFEGWDFDMGRKGRRR